MTSTTVTAAAAAVVAAAAVELHHAGVIRDWRLASITTQPDALKRHVGTQTCVVCCVNCEYTATTHSQTAGTGATS
jgi:hypothetical protein